MRLKSTVDAYWRDALGCEFAGTGVAWRPKLPGFDGIYILMLEDRVCVAGPAEYRDGTADQVADPQWWSRRLGDRAVAVHGPSVHYYLDDCVSLPPSDAMVMGRPAIAALRRECTDAEWNEGGFGDAEAEYFGLVRDGSLVAAANLTEWNGGLRDIGVLTHPQRRGRGFGRIVAAAAARHAIRRYGAVRYRALAGNSASRSIAVNLGCTEYGANLAIRLRDRRRQPVDRRTGRATG